MVSPTPSALVVAHHQRWVAEDMEAGTAGRWPILHSPSLSRRPTLPVHGPAAWWVTTGHAARLLHNDIDLTLDLAGPDWLPSLPTTYTGRSIRSLPLAAAGKVAAGTAGFIKPATAKVDQLPAAWTDDIGRTARDAIAAGAHPDTAVQVSDTRLDLQVEHRVFVLDGTPVASSPYLVDGVVWEPGWDAASHPTSAEAVTFAAEVGAAVPCPDAVVIDVARARDGRWVVVEANAPWASNPYGADLRGVVDCVVASTCGRPRSQWTFVPDPHEAAVAAAMHPLQPAW